MHLIIAKYADDAERKRIEYILEKWKGRLNVTKPDGIVAITSGSNTEIYSLAEELYAKTSRDKITVFRIEKNTVEIEQSERKLKVLVREKRETVEKLLNFIMARQKAVLKHISPENYETIYEVTSKASKKGKAEIAVYISERNELVNIEISITGYGEVVEYIYNKLNEEMKYLKE